MNIQSAFAAGVMAALLAAPALAQPQAAALAPTCPVPATAPTWGTPPDLQGQWDFVIQAGDRASPGVMALGPMDGAYAGSLTPDATNTVAVRRLELVGDKVRMSVASREGEVTFEGRLSADGKSMCGIVNYHGGLKYPMVATLRPRPPQG